MRIPRKVFLGVRALMTHSTRKEFLSSETGSFHRAIGPVLVFAQIFGAMPVYGVCEKDPIRLKFYWRSYRTFHSIIMSILQTLFLITIFKSSIKNGWTIFKFTLYVVYISVIYILLNMIFIAQKWPRLMMHWQNVESTLPQLRSIREKGILKLRIRNVAIVVTLLSLMEHLLGIAATVHVTNACPKYPDNLLKSFFVEHLPVLFDAIEYSGWRAFLGKSINLVNTFIWFYVDLFVMLIAIGLSSVFKQYCDFLVKYTGKSTSKEFWEDQRNMYRRICELVDAVDDAISPITIVSFSNNLYFICLQLMNTLSERRSKMHSIYFWYTLVYLVARTAAVCLLSAEINEQSKRPMALFRHIPLESWCSEAKRFSEDVTDTVSALSGLKFFYLTRKLLLSVAGTIVTYELVIMQFYKDGSSGITVCTGVNSTNSSVI